MGIRRLRREDGERGAFLVLFALALVAILIMVALVIDLGDLRRTRRTNQAAADLAAVASGARLAGQTTAIAFSDPRGACRDALNSLRTNLEDLPVGTTVPCDTLPPTGAEPDCFNEGTATPTPKQTLTDGGTASPYEVTIEYPVPSTDIALSQLQTGAGPLDGEQCERMRISVRKTTDSYFARIMGVDDQSVSASAVVRGTIDSDNLSVAALILLERSACGALQTSGGGNNQFAVVVQAGGPSTPGRISADSAGIVGSGCTTNNNAGGWVVYGTALPNGERSILADDAPDGTRATLTIWALVVGGRGGAEYPTGISPQPSPGPISSRQPVDDKYNPSSRPAITDLHQDAYALTTSASTPAGYVEVDCSADGTIQGLASTRIFVRCANYSPVAAVFADATHVVFSGKVTVGTGSTLAFPTAQRIFVRGCTSNCNGGNYYAIDVAGTMTINKASALTCADRAGPGTTDPDGNPIGTNTNWAALATFNGPYKVSGAVSMCQTFVYLGKNEPTYARQTATSGGPNCSAAKPCPVTSNTGDGYIEISGGSADADWSAPNQLTGDPNTTHPFEDLALWGEAYRSASQPAALKATGNNRAEGVYFMPNAAVSFTGQAAQNQPLNAQFISRTLNISGQGSLFLKPNPNDSVKSPVPGDLQLIR